MHCVVPVNVPSCRRPVAWMLWLFAWMGLATGWPQEGWSGNQVKSTLNVEVVTPAPKEGEGAAQRVTLKLHFDASARPAQDEVVALLRSPYLPTRLLPLDREEATHGWTATIDLDPPDFTGLPSDRNLVPITCLIAQRRGGQLLTLATHTVRVTVNAAASTETAPRTAGPSAPKESGLADAPEAEPIGMVDPPPQAIALAPARIKEQSLLPETSPKPSPAYWRGVKARIIQRVRERHQQTTGTRSLGAPTVHFRLFANGTAQSIRLEPGSGDTQFDQAVVQSVLDAQPFPPFPTEVSDPHLDVHLTLPSLPARPIEQTPTP